jgi:hypothetical protein
MAAQKNRCVRRAAAASAYRAWLDPLLARPGRKSSKADGAQLQQRAHFQGKSSRRDFKTSLLFLTHNQHGVDGTVMRRFVVTFF